VRLTLRTRLVLVAFTAAVAFGFITLTGLFAGDRVLHELTSIRDHYVPKVALRPRLEAELDELARSFQDAAAAEDVESLGRAREARTAFLSLLAEAAETLDPEGAAELRLAFDEYYSVATDVTRRLIAKETGEVLVSSIAEMQAERARVLELIERGTSVTKDELEAAFSTAVNAQRSATRTRLATSIGAILLLMGLVWWLSRDVLRSMAALTAGFARFGRSELEQPIVTSGRDELATVAASANEMARNLRSLARKRDRSEWIDRGDAGLAQELRGELPLAEVGSRAIRFLAGYLGAPVGAIYYAGRTSVFRLLADHARTESGDGRAVDRFELGEGLVGQAALSSATTIITKPPDGYLRVRSGLGEASPRAVVLEPLRVDGRAVGILELAVFEPWSDASTELLRAVNETLAIALEVAQAREAMRELLDATRAQAERLAAQDEELRANNEELHAQQEELRATNEELVQQATALEAQHRVVEQKNQELEETRRVLEENAAALSTVSAYKSQFLANMSHELRTPLNSMLLLSSLLAENAAGNLTPKQAEQCKTIHAAGVDLLALINQVLDLAKIESGKQELNPEVLSLGPLLEHLTAVFEPLASEKGLRFVAEREPGAVETITTDRPKLVQVLNNLLGNAIKFTERGEIRIVVGAPASNARFRRRELRPDNVVTIAISDTGAGIAAEHRDRIFDPFEQADPSTGRRYGGTGLGLAIARDIASLLGGEIHLASAIGEGSTFALHLPHERIGLADEAARPAPPDILEPLEDAEAPGEGAFRVLVVEDDATTGDPLVEFLTRAGVSAHRVGSGEEGLRALDLGSYPCIVLDLSLPGMDGLDLLRSIAERAPKPSTIIYTARSLTKAETQRIEENAHAVVMKEGASFERLLAEIKLSARKHSIRPSKPSAGQALADVDPRLDGRTILLVDDDMRTVYALSAMLRSRGAEILVADTGRAALASLTERPSIDAILMDIMMPEMDGYEAMRRIRGEARFGKVPIIALTAKAMRGDGEKCIESGASDYLPKPIDPHALLQILDRHLRGSNGR
jgi:signal transduction histidine kinase/DNA-binding response OmpR family regulator